MDTREMSMSEVNQLYVEDEEYLREYPNLVELLQQHQQTFITYDQDKSGDINVDELETMLDKLGQVGGSAPDIFSYP